ncbi:MAG: tRNA (guanine37-N1)-methyltransferase, partial [Parcubacteria group bacterium Gr01-1014_66]
MRFDIITIFPELFGPYLNESLLKRACEKKIVQFNIHNIRGFTEDLHKKVDDHPYGGGPGMVFMVKPLAHAIEALPKKEKNLMVLLSASGTQFDARMAA